jgi:flagellar biosynthesis protein FlhF
VRLGELRRCLEAAAPHEIHLVLSGTAGERVLLREAEAFSGAGADRLVVTKLDETITFGSLINVLHRVGKGLSFVTTGQEVPDHIEVGRPRRIAELALGAAVHA